MFCYNCGKQIPDDSKFCHYCGAEQKREAAPAKEPPAPAAPPAPPVQHPPRAPQPAPRPAVSEQPPRERVGAGILGALLGSLGGVVVMVLLDRLGYVSSLSGIIMLAGAAWGYAHFGKALGTKGLLICIPIVIAMVYFGSRVCWTITVRGLYTSTVKPDYVSLFMGLADQLKYSGLEDSYYESLAQQYAFAGIGVVLLVINVIRNNRAAKKNNKR